jgi:hypothetical protein
MFRALLAYPQEEPHKRHLVYCLRIMSVGCGTVAVSRQPCHSQLYLHFEDLCDRYSAQGVCKVNTSRNVKLATRLTLVGRLQNS